MEKRGAEGKDVVTSMESVGDVPDPVETWMKKGGSDSLIVHNNRLSRKEPPAPFPECGPGTRALTESSQLVRRNSARNTTG